MKKLISLMLIVVMVLGCISLAACGGGGGGAEQNGGGAEQGNGGNGGDEGGNGGDEGGNGGNGGDEGASDNLEDILGLGAGITSVQYDMVMTTTGMPQMTTHMWLKQNKMKTETTAEGQTVIMIYDGDAGFAYTYMPDLNMAYKMTLDPATMTESAMGEAQSIPDYDYVELGTETIDGKECLVVQYTYQGTTTKMWIWKEYGFPIKMEMTSAQGTSTVEYQNIEFGDIDDSEFELPAGVTIIDMG